MKQDKRYIGRLHSLVNAFGVSMIKISEKVGVSLTFNKGGVCLGINAPGSRVAALLSLYGEGAHGTITFFLSEKAFASYVNGMTGGMLFPDPEEPVAVSVAGELANMVSGNALTTLSERGFSGLDITPPQLFVGTNIKSLKLPEDKMDTFTLPFYVGNDRESIVHQVLLFRK
ncbi:chemotaxis protein CheX [Aminiphilus circumscriptus]|mgnify:CR=1 FL=1|uniref:chemotaxis protein CheX n=1 Tax=Aminiphilus circumscriptus TaxID=290732 RepID=UPI000492C16B|nr:chemotaxis protein CheX [Aminiphilus circumscriptus]